MYMYATLVVLVMMSANLCRNGNTALMSASSKGHLDCVRDLMDKGACPCVYK